MSFFDDPSNLFYTNPITAGPKGVYDLTKPDGPGMGRGFDATEIARLRSQIPDIASADKALADFNAGGLPALKAFNPDDVRRAIMGIKGEYGQAAEKKATEDSSYNSVLDKLFGTAQESGLKQIQSQYGGLQKELAERQAAAGRFDSPVAAIPELSLATEEGQAESNLIGSLASARISPQIDLYKTGREMDYAKSQSAEDKALAMQLGQLQADTAKYKPPKDWSDYLNLGLTGGNTALMSYLAFA